MAWVRWRVDRRGARVAYVQWRDRAGSVRSRSLGEVSARAAEEARRDTAEREEGAGAPKAVVEAREALRAFLASRQPRDDGGELRRASWSVGFAVLPPRIRVPRDVGGEQPREWSGRPTRGG